MGPIHLIMFDKAICINLDHRKDRWELAQREFDAFGIEVERFQAIQDENPMKGIHMSYQRIFQENAGKQILILEDDVHFTRSYPALLEAYNELPDRWRMLYLGGNATQTLKRVGNWLYRAKGVVTTHAILYGDEMTTWLAENMKIPEIVDRTNTIDVWFAHTLQHQFPSFIVYPQAAEQRFGYSDICKMDINYKYFNNQAKRFYK
jgi:GR25 family glycosyltransferase involved in LPS biosynthesis